MSCGFFYFAYNQNYQREGGNFDEQKREERKEQ